MTDQKEKPEKKTKASPAKDPVRQWTLRLILLSFVLLIFYLISDRITPYTSQARVHALVVPVAPEVSGTVTDVLVSNNQTVAAGSVLFRIDPTMYELAVASAEANLETARQSAGASEAALVAAESQVQSARVNLAQAEQDARRLRQIKAQDAGAISDRRIESAESSLKVSKQRLISAEANLEAQRRNLGQQGELNSHVQQAKAALNQAKVNLAYTLVYAPTDGVVTDVRVDKGNFAAAGHPLMTFISSSNIWVQADFTENNLGHVDVGDAAEVLFDVYPGRVFKGEVREMGFGVAVDSAPLGSLPTIQNDRNWLRDAQRFPVVVAFEMDREEMTRLRVGAQVSVTIYASDSWIFNTLAKIYLRIGSILSYAY